jgi:hypothetical protein
MAESAIAMRVGVNGRLSFGAPACRTSILACRSKVIPTVYHPAVVGATPQPPSPTVEATHLSDLHPEIDATMASPLEGCVGSLRNSMQLLDSSINILTEGVNDFPRLARVLQTTRVSFPCLNWYYVEGINLTLHNSTLNSSLNPIFKQPSPRSSQKFVPRSTISSSE